MNRADYIVVGGGSAGCVLAARLSENPRTRVVLLEAGDTDVGRWAMRMPLAWRDTFMQPAVSWGYVTEPEPFGSLLRASCVSRADFSRPKRPRKSSSMN
jgi:choline dehydrogenase